MIDNRRVLAVVPARGGSKGVPGKNLREVGGVSLLRRTLDAATASRYIDVVVVSSDDDGILRHASSVHGVLTVERPAELAEDGTAMAPVVDHVLSLHPADIVVLLQPTSPLRESADIDGALGRFASAGADSLVSVCTTETSPYWMYRLDGDDRMHPLLPKLDVATRQELPPTYRVNGAVYVVDAEWFRTNHVFVGEDTVAYVMAPERSLDVDTELDLVVAEALLARRGASGAPGDK
jgi:N-acylneuraminate cytidylyltransferase